MGWVADEYDNNDDTTKPPVDALVDSLTDYLESKSEICVGYAGPARQCCENIKTCFDTLRTALVNVKAIHQDTQDLGSACRDTQHQLYEVSTCVDNKTSRCPTSIGRSDIRTPFYDAINELFGIYHGFCTPKPPPTTTTTTTTTTTQSPTTTTTAEIIRTEDPTTFTDKSTTTTTGTPEQTTLPDKIVTVGDGLPASNNSVTSLPDNYDDTIIIVSSAVVATVIVLAIVILTVFCIWRKRKSGPYGSESSAASKKGFIWKWLSNAKPDPQYADSEIYTEIDEAFMDAVYHASRDPPPKVRDKVQTTAQINICYGTGEDDIIQGNKEPAKPPDVSEYEIPVPSTPRDSTSLNDVIKTSSITPSGQNVIITQQGGYENITKGIISNAVLVLPSKKGFIMSRPTFTAVNQSTSAEYVQIEARLPEDNIYAVPTDSIYDKTTRFGDTNKPQRASPNIYDTTRAFDRNNDVTKGGVTKRKQNKNEVLDNRNRQSSPNYIYENPCLEY